MPEGVRAHACFPRSDLRGTGGLGWVWEIVLEHRLRSTSEAHIAHA
jgi:hypothetical protein